MKKSELRKIIKEELMPVEDIIEGITDQLEYIRHMILKGRLEYGPQTKDAIKQLNSSIKIFIKSLKRG